MGKCNLQAQTQNGRISGFYRNPQTWNQPPTAMQQAPMEVDKGLVSDIQCQGTSNQPMPIISTKGKGKQKASTIELRRQEVEETEEHLEKIIQHTEDAGADLEVAKLVINDEATYALIEMLLARIDALRGKNWVIE